MTLYEWACEKINEADPNGVRLGEDEYLQACSELEAMAADAIFRKLQREDPETYRKLMGMLDQLPADKIEEMTEDAISLAE